MNEFNWIKTLLVPLAGKEGLMLQDDAALYSPDSKQDLVLTNDMLVEGIHFLDGEYGAGTAERLLLVNLSDLAAKGAEPIGYLLSIAWPNHLKNETLKRWMSDFVKGLASVQNEYDFKLFGGDTVRTDGPLTISATFLGVVPQGEMVKRSGANVGDIVWATGTIGDAHLGLRIALKDKSFQAYKPSGDDIWEWGQAFRRPTPRLLFREILREFATSCADISDGLLSEADHIAVASKKQIELFLSCVPLSEASQKWCVSGDEEKRRVTLSSAGDDYELIFTAASKDSHAIQNAARAMNLRVSKIGRVKDGEGITCIGLAGKPVTINKMGYQH